MVDTCREVLEAPQYNGLTLCISIASHPGIFGKAIHSAGYEALGLPFAYIPLRVTEGQLPDIFSIMREKPVRGCSVSMPHKRSVIPYLNEIAEAAGAIGAVNTIINNDGTLSGDNTDKFGAKEVLKKIGITPVDSVLLLGAGGAAAAVASALGELGIRHISYCARNPAAAGKLHDNFGGTDVLPWEEKESQGASLLINATPLGFGDYPCVSPISKEGLKRFNKVFDLVPLQADTPLIILAREMGMPHARGIEMALEQAFIQFELYTGKKVPREFVVDKLKATGILQ